MEAEQTAENQGNERDLTLYLFVVMKPRFHLLPFEETSNIYNLLVHIWPGTTVRFHRRMQTFFQQLK